jgi:HAD superfamily hydrolase (TIGR01490 family)
VDLLAFYDLDRTVTRLPTWSAFLLFASARRSPWRLALAPAVGAAMVGYKTGLTSRARLKELMYRLMLGPALPAASLAQLAEEFAARVVARNIRPGALDRIAADRADGYRVVLATAAHRFYAGAIAERLGIADVIATEAVLGPTGEILPLIDGANVYGDAKLRAVTGWLEAQGIARDTARLRFYSDHASDAPCLAFADEGFAVNPHRPLRMLALANGWRILDWRADSALPDDVKGQTCTPSS